MHRQILYSIMNINMIYNILVSVLNVGRERDRCTILRGFFPPKKKTCCNLELDICNCHLQLALIIGILYCLLELELGI